MSATGSVSPDDPVIRILLMGRKGSGKSSSGNTILGEKRFKVQKKKQKAKVNDEKAQMGDAQVCVLECPDLLDPDLSKEQCERLRDQLISRCSAGLSSVLITVPLEEPVQNEEEILRYVTDLFGPEVQKFLMILFTHGDELEDLDQTIEEYLKEHEDLRRLVTECGGKFHCFDNKSKSGDQRRELLWKIKGMMMENERKFKKLKRAVSKEAFVDFSAEDPGEVQIPEKKDQIRLVLLGKTGSGKSATGNTIIGRNVFQSTMSSKSETKVCQSESTVRFGKEIMIIDTPGLYDTKLSETQTTAEICTCITHASPGPHTFLIVIKLGRFTEEEKNTIEKLKEAFGEHMEKYSMILFTHKELLEKKNKSIEEFLQNGDPDLRKLVEHCGNRFFCVENESASFPQFRRLMEKIEKMVEENGGHFTNEMLNETEKTLQEIQKEKLGEKVKQYKQENKRVRQTEWQTIFWRLVEESRNDAKRVYFDTFMADSIMSANVPDLRTALKNLVTDEERDAAVKEAERKGIKHGKAVRLALTATRTLVKKNICKTQ